MDDLKRFSRKKIKRDAKKVVRSHYILLVVVCMIAVMFGTEFGFVRSNADNLYKLATGQEIHIGEDTVQLGKSLVKATTGSDIREGVATSVKDQLESGVNKDTAGNLAGSVADQTASDLQGDSEEQSAIDRVLEDLLNDDAESGNAHAY